MPPSAGYQPWVMHGDTSPPGCSTQLGRECLADERSCREHTQTASFLGGPAALAVCTILRSTLCETACPGHVSWGYGQFLHMLGYLVPWREAPLSNGQHAIRHPWCSTAACCSISMKSNAVLQAMDSHRTNPRTTLSEQRCI